MTKQNYQDIILIVENSAHFYKYKQIISIG